MSSTRTRGLLTPFDRLGDAQIVVLLTLLGVLARVGHLATPYMDSDQAVFGLQALHVLKGEFPAFSWGYAYIGTLQTFIDAIFFAVFGASRVVLNAVVLLFYVGYSISLYYLGAAFFAERRWRALVAALGAIAPGYFIHHGVWARHGYPETFFFGTLILALICNHLEPEERPRFHAGLFFVAGLAWWSNFLILYYFLPLGIYLLYQMLMGSSLRARARIVAAATLGFVTGSLPFWVHNLRHGFDSMSMFRKAPAGREDLEKIATTGWNTFTVLVGAREQGADYTVKHLGAVLAVLSAAALLFFAVQRAVLLSRIPARRRLVPGDILFAFFVSLLLVFASSGQSVRFIRYLIPFYSLYPIYLAYALRSLRGAPGGRWPAAALTIFLFAMNSASALKLNPLLDRQWREGYFASAARDQRLIDSLVQADRRQVLTYIYWDAYRLTFDARERVIVDHVNSRHPEYLFDMFSGPVLSYLSGWQNPSFEGGVRLLGYSFAPRQLESAILYTDFVPAFPRDLSTLPAASYRLTSADGGAAGDVLNDHLLSTSHPLAVGDGATERFVEAQFSEPTSVAGLALFPETAGDAPTHIRVSDRDTGSVLAEGEDVYYGYSLGRHPYLPGAPPLLEVLFPPHRTRGLRVSFLGPTRRPGFAAKEVLIFESRRGERDGSDEQLFERFGRRVREAGIHGVICGLAAVRPTEKALGREVAYAREREVTFEERNLFVFEKEYLRHNLEVLEALGIVSESGAGDTFAFIATRGTGWGKARWIEKALFLARDTALAESDYRRAAKIAATDGAGAEVLLRKALARDPDHFSSLCLLERLAERSGDDKSLAEIRARRERLLPAARLVEADFGSAIELKALALGAGRLRPGENFTLNLALTPRERLRADHWIFLHFLSPEGKILFQVDRQLAPARGAKLQPGELVKLENSVTIPADLAFRGPVGVWFGIAKPDGGKKLKIRSALEVRANRVKIGELSIVP